MRTAESKYGSTSELGRSELTPVVVRDAVLTAIGTLALTSVAVIHLVQIVPTFKATPLLGGAFVLLIAGAVALAARLIVRSDRPTWTAVGLLSFGAIAGYVFTRMISTPLDNQDVGNWACMLGIAALFMEAALVALSRDALTVKRALRPVPVSVLAATNGHVRVSSEHRLQSS